MTTGGKYRYADRIRQEEYNESGAGPDQRSNCKLTDYQHNLDEREYLIQVNPR